MRSVIFCLLICFLSPDTFAQDSTSLSPKRIRNGKFSFGMFLGVSAPSGAYGNKKGRSASDTQQVNGFAKTGFHFNINFNYNFAKCFGARFLMGGNINPFDVKAFQTTYVSATSYSTTVLSAGPHYLGQYLIGPYTTIRASAKVSFELSALVGLVTSSFAKLKETTDWDKSTSSSSTKFKTGYAFGYNFGLGGKYRATDQLDLVLNVSYLGAGVSYSGYVNSNSGYPAPLSGLNGTETYHAKKKMELGMVILSFGTVFIF